MIFDGAWDGKPWKLLAVAVFSSAMLAACVSDDSSGKQEAPLIADGEYVPVRPESPPGWPAIQWPADNAFTPAKAILGRRLFAETRLSRDGTVSCMWCHDDARAYSDKHSIGLSRGVRQQFTLRNAPTLTNVAFGKRFFFEGDVSTLEEQALRPLYASGEMDMTGSEIEAMLAADSAYPRLFRQAFGDAPITMAHLTQALATYERTLISAHSPYDRWAGGDTGALSASAKRGAAVFFGKGGCAACHAPPLFTDGGFHNTGLDSVPSDSGLFRTSRRLADVGKFKTPTLRNIEVTGPYMHDGRFPDLEDVIAHYSAGGKASVQRDSLLRPLSLNDSAVIDLVEFLKSLTDLAELFRASPD